MMGCEVQCVAEFATPSVPASGDVNNNREAQMRSSSSEWGRRVDGASSSRRVAL